ncbi:hypothetical protein FQA39_LY16018 [Lamprigera yunnana]|nr:hypothetical protein FQA39_LY16018 [Lamprigera yunnana]
MENDPLTCLLTAIAEDAVESKQDECSTVHTGDTDSSDDEENRDVENSKYNEYGRGIKRILGATAEERPRELIPKKASSWLKKGNNETSLTTIEPLFGVRVVNPLLATNVLEDRMKGREFIPLHRIKAFSKNTVDKDWVVSGVIVGKSATKLSQKGKNFSIWTISDLRMSLQTISLFLFGRAHEELWKTTIGTVVGILNPSVLDLRDGSKDEAHLSVNNHQLVMVLGKSKDLGTCKSFKKSGERCTAFVNVSICEFCVYHVRMEYQKCSKRSELQSSFSGKGLNALRNKVLGKNQVFYAGKLYSAIPEKSNKQRLKDQGRLNFLAGHGKSQPSKSNTQKPKLAAQLELQAGQREKDLERIKQLGINIPIADNAKVEFNDKHSQDVSVVGSKSYALEVIKKLKETSKDVSKPKKSDVASMGVLKNSSVNVPVLTGSTQFEVDLNAPLPRKECTKAKKIALAWVQNNGPIEKMDPNGVRGKPTKRKLTDLDVIPEEKKAKIQENEFFSDRFKKMIAATSSHANLLEEMENEKQQQYFQKLEMKERMEDKMLSTYKVPCKAVTCLKCKYTNFSASDLCKTDKHPLKVFNATKRFFKCGKCGNRTVSLSVVPMDACKNCGSGKWERTSMMRERKDGIVAPTLSIRGGEQKFVNSVVTDSHLVSKVVLFQVCSIFNYIGSKLLTRGFFQVEKRHGTVYKRMKSMLPRRESERRSHPLSRHCDILSAVETRLSMLSMTYLRYMENNLCCFIPGKVVDEINRILSLVDKVKPAPRTHEVVQELRDISSMAMEHFDEIILPRMKQRVEYQGLPITSLTSTKSPKDLLLQMLSEQIQKMKKITKLNKQQFSYIEELLKNLNTRFKRQTKILRDKSLMLKKQENKLQEQALKLQEHESTIADLKKHMEEWNQKFSDLSTELMKSKEDAKQQPLTTEENSNINQNAKVDPKPCIGYFKAPHIEIERKRKSSIICDSPTKLIRTSMSDNICNKINENITNNISKSITDNIIKIGEIGKRDEKVREFISRRTDFVPFLSSSLEFLLKAPVGSIKSRKRKIYEDVDMN